MHAAERIHFYIKITEMHKAHKTIPVILVFGTLGSTNIVISP